MLFSSFLTRNLETPWFPSSFAVSFDTRAQPLCCRDREADDRFPLHVFGFFSSTHCPVREYGRLWLGKVFIDNSVISPGNLKIYSDKLLENHHKKEMTFSNFCLLLSQIFPGGRLVRAHLHSDRRRRTVLDFHRSLHFICRKQFFLYRKVSSFLLSELNHKNDV